MSSPISWETALARSAEAKHLESARLESERLESKRLASGRPGSDRKPHPFPRFAALRSRNRNSHR